jgi:hypothetical protein
MHWPKLAGKSEKVSAKSLKQNMSDITSFQDLSSLLPACFAAKWQFPLRRLDISSHDTVHSFYLSLL